MLAEPHAPDAAASVPARLEGATGAVGRADLHRRRGRVCDLIGLVVEATGLEAEVGEVCDVAAGRGRGPVPAEVVGFRAGRTLLMPLGEIHGIGPGHAVTATGQPARVPVGDELLGRVVDGLGRPIDGLDRPLPAPARSTRRRSAPRTASTTRSGSTPSAPCTT